MNNKNKEKNMKTLKSIYEEQIKNALDGINIPEKEIINQLLTYGTFTIITELNDDEVEIKVVDKKQMSD